METIRERYSRLLLARLPMPKPMMRTPFRSLAVPENCKGLLAEHPQAAAIAIIAVVVDVAIALAVNGGEI